MSATSPMTVNTSATRKDRLDPVPQNVTVPPVKAPLSTRIKTPIQASESAVVPAPVEWPETVKIHTAQLPASLPNKGAASASLDLLAGHKAQTPATPDPTTITSLKNDAAADSNPKPHAASLGKCPAESTTKTPAAPAANPPPDSNQEPPTAPVIKPPTYLTSNSPADNSKKGVHAPSAKASTAPHKKTPAVPSTTTPATLTVKAPAPSKTPAVGSPSNLQSPNVTSIQTPAGRSTQSVPPPKPQSSALDARKRATHPPKTPSPMPVALTKKQERSVAPAVVKQASSSAASLRVVGRDGGHIPVGPPKGKKKVDSGKEPSASSSGANASATQKPKRAVRKRSNTKPSEDDEDRREDVEEGNEGDSEEGSGESSNEEEEEEEELPKTDRKGKGRAVDVEETKGKKRKATTSATAGHASKRGKKYSVSLKPSGYLYPVPCENCAKHGRPCVEPLSQRGSCVPCKVLHASCTYKNRLRPTEESTQKYLGPAVAAVPRKTKNSKAAQKKSTTLHLPPPPTLDPPPAAISASVHREETPRQPSQPRESSMQRAASAMEQPSPPRAFSPLQRPSSHVPFRFGDNTPRFKPFPLTADGSIDGNVIASAIHNMEQYIWDMDDRHTRELHRVQDIIVELDNTVRWFIHALQFTAPAGFVFPPNGIDATTDASRIEVSVNQSILDKYWQQKAEGKTSTSAAGQPSSEGQLPPIPTINIIDATPQSSQAVIPTDQSEAGPSGRRSRPSGVSTTGTEDPTDPNMHAGETSERDELPEDNGVTIGRTEDPSPSIDALAGDANSGTAEEDGKEDGDSPEDDREEGDELDDDGVERNRPADEQRQEDIEDSGATPVTPPRLRPTSHAEELAIGQALQNVEPTPGAGPFDGPGSISHLVPPPLRRSARSRSPTPAKQPAQRKSKRKAVDVVDGDAKRRRK
ncbi:hypothetical protein BDN70DRAFT_939554 [Pholiota conissans]|uniref:Zn(2)-C6 fungal-type domain-containing protein n=1 Tax=Pholiota conissans TaxID=109636 RepID=A0A9P6CS19_9AGAR|nr:hypothetical protein BDN70DRAFT_939554 [Pholiota conissans]